MRLVTRADFDGLVCGALVTKFEKIEDYLTNGVKLVWVVEYERKNVTVYRPDREPTLLSVSRRSAG